MTDRAVQISYCDLPLGHLDCGPPAHWGYGYIFALHSAIAYFDFCDKLLTLKSRTVQNIIL